LSSMSTPPDPFEFLKSLWGPMGLPLAGLGGPAAAMSEVDRRIAELKSVETWLNMNLNVLRMSIQALEMQKAGLAAMQGAAEAATGAASTSASQPPEGGEAPAKK
jgi:hypothetical protein